MSFGVHVPPAVRGSKGGITCRFFADLHGFRKLLKETEELRGERWDGYPLSI
jgi:hypothetical protein